MKILFCLQCLVISLLMSSCGFLMLATTDIKKPKIKYSHHKIKKVTTKMVKVNLNLSVYNPNTIGVKNVFVKYKVFAEGIEISSGKDIAITLDPQKKTIVTVPVKVLYSDLLTSLASVIKKLMQKSKTLPIEIRATVYGKPTVYNQMTEGSIFSFTHEEKKVIKIPLPSIKNQVKDKIKQIKKLF